MFGMTVQYLRIRSGDLLSSLDRFSPFKAIVVVEDVVDQKWQAEASRWLADSGCLYMMAWGKNCSSWDDSVDLANLEQFGFDKIPDDDFVMTTWHDDEPLQEVIWFAKYSANHPTIELENVLFMHIGSSNREGEFEDMYRNA